MFLLGRDTEEIADVGFPSCLDGHFFLKSAIRFLLTQAPDNRSPIGVAGYQLAMGPGQAQK